MYLLAEKRRSATSSRSSAGMKVNWNRTVGLRLPYVRYCTQGISAKRLKNAETTSGKSYNLVVFPTALAGSKSVYSILVVAPLQEVATLKQVVARSK